MLSNIKCHTTNFKVLLLFELFSFLICDLIFGLISLFMQYLIEGSDFHCLLRCEVSFNVSKQFSDAYPRTIDTFLELFEF